MISIFDTSSGALIKRVYSTTGESMTGRQSVADPAGFDEATYAWSTANRVMQVDTAKVQAAALAKIDSARDTQRRTVLTMGIIGQGHVYSAKQRELDNWQKLGTATALDSVLYAAYGLLNATERARNFRYAIEEATLRGETVMATMARWRPAIDAAETALAKIDAIAVKAKDEVRAATVANKPTIASAATTSMQAIA